MGVVSTINLERFLCGNSANQKAVATETDHICSEIGFLSVVGHGVSDTIIQNIYESQRIDFKSVISFTM